MDVELIDEHQVRLERQYLRRIGNLLRLKRFNEAADTTLYLASILRMWAVQQNNIKVAAEKGLDRSK